jgi:hypothetical protein
VPIRKRRRGSAREMIEKGLARVFPSQDPSFPLER